MSAPTHGRDDAVLAPSEPATRPAVRVLQIALVVVSVVLLGSALRQASLGAAAALLARTGPWAAIALLPPLLANAFQTLGWLPVLERLGHRLRAGRVLFVRVASEAVFMSAPAGTAVADSVALVLLERRLGVPIPAGLAAMAARRALLVLTNGFYVALAFVLGRAHLERAAAQIGAGPWLAWLVLAMAALLLAGSALMSLALFSGRLASGVQRALEHIPLLGRRVRSTAFAETDRQLASLPRMPRSRLAASIAWFFLAWLVEAVDTWIVLRLVGAPLGFSEALSVEVLVSLLRSLAFVLPSAVGVQDAGYVTLLAAFGVPDAATTGLAFLVLKRAKDVAWIAAGYALLGANRKRTARTRSEELPGAPMA